MKQPDHVLSALEERVTQLQDRPALWTRGRRHFLPTSWRQFGQRVRDQAVGLMALGVGRKDAVGVPELARMEAWVARLAVLATGAAYVSLPALPPDAEEVQRRLQAAGAKASYVWGPSPPPPQKGSRAVTFLSLNTPVEEGGDTFETLMERGAAAGDADYWMAARDVPASSVAAWLFDEKGPVTLSHANLVWTTWKRVQALELGEDSTLLSDWENGESDAHHWLWTCLSGSELAFAPQPMPLLDLLRDVRPTVLQAPAEIWAALAREASVAVARGEGPLGWPLAHARRLSLEHQRRVEAKERVPLTLQAQREAGRLWLSRVHRILGLDRVRVAVSPGVALTPDTLELFASLDLVICESHGTPATSGLVTLNVPGQTRLGSAGRPVLGVEVRVDAKSLLWVRGQNVSTTRAAEHRWLCLGPGRMDEDGYVWLERRTL